MLCACAPTFSRITGARDFRQEGGGEGEETEKGEKEKILTKDNFFLSYQVTFPRGQDKKMHPGPPYLCEHKETLPAAARLKFPKKWGQKKIYHLNFYHV